MVEPQRANICVQHPVYVSHTCRIFVFRTKITDPTCVRTVGRKSSTYSRYTSRPYVLNSEIRTIYSGMYDLFRQQLYLCNNTQTHTHTCTIRTRIRCRLWPFRLTRTLETFMKASPSYFIPSTMCSIMAEESFGRRGDKWKGGDTVCRAKRFKRKNTNLSKCDVTS